MSTRIVDIKTVVQRYTGPLDTGLASLLECSLWSYAAAFYGPDFERVRKFMHVLYLQHPTRAVLTGKAGARVCILDGAE